MLLRVQQGQPPTPLSPALQLQLERWAVDGGDAPPEILQLFASLHLLGGLACDCRGQADQPTACVVRLSRGDLILRWYNGIAHDAACPLQRQSEDRPPTERARSGQAGVVRPWTEGWDLLGPVVTRARLTGTEPVAPREPGDRSPRMPRLGRVLLSALQRCGYAQVGVPDLHLKEPALPRVAQVWERRIFRLLGEPVTETLTFQQTCAIGLDRLQQWLDVRLPLALPEFGKMRPQGVLIGLVNEISVVRRQSRLIGFAGDAGRASVVDIPVRRFGPCTQGPWWVILQAAQVPGTRGFALVDGYAHPAFSTALPVPVDSHAERELLQVVLGQLLFWKRYPKTKTYVTAVKPVHDTVTEHGPCRPDLLLSFQDAQRRRHALVLECMGMDDPGYRERKLRTHAAMRALPDVHGLFEFHPGAVPLEDLRRQLTSALFAGARQSAPSPETTP